MSSDQTQASQVTGHLTFTQQTMTASQCCQLLLLVISGSDYICLCECVCLQQDNNCQLLSSLNNHFNRLKLQLVASPVSLSLHITIIYYTIHDLSVQSQHTHQFYDHSNAMGTGSRVIAPCCYVIHACQYPLCVFVRHN